MIRAALPIQVIEIESPTRVEVGGDGDDSVGDVREQQVGEREVTEVIRADLPLEAVVGPPFRDEHDPGVVDQDVQIAGPRGGECAH